MADSIGTARAPRTRGVEWRVVYRRAGWKPTSDDRRRVFQTEEGARGFATRLAAGRSHLSALTVLRVEQRPVGRWRPVDLSDERGGRSGGACEATPSEAEQ